MQDLRDQVESKTDNDDEILLAVNTKVEEWKVCISVANVGYYERPIFSTDPNVVLGTTFDNSNSYWNCHFMHI